MTLAEKLRDKMTVWDAAKYMGLEITWEEFEEMWQASLEEKRRKELQ